MFSDPWDFGPRRKKLLLGDDSIDVDETYCLGMASRVFPGDQLAAPTHLNHCSVQSRKLLERARTTCELT